MRRTKRHITRIIRAPTTAAETRQPNGSIPNAFSPRAISHLPTSGCTAREGVSFHRSVVWPPRIALSASPM